MDENQSVFRNASLYVGVAVIIIVSLAIFGLVRLFQNRVGANTATKPSPSPKASAPATTKDGSSPQPQSQFGSPSPIPGTNAAANTVQTQPESGSDTQTVKRSGIWIIRPQQSQSVTSPQSVTGMANVLGDLQVVIRDSNGNVLGTSWAKACVGIDACPFGVNVTFQKPQTSIGSIEVSSPQDSKNFTQTISVNFN